MKNRLPTFFKNCLAIAGALTIFFGASSSLALAQTGGVGTPSLKFGLDQAISLRAGSPITVPIFINTQGRAVDGVQLVAAYEGVEVKDVALILSGKLGMAPISQAVSPKGFAVMLIPSDPNVPFVAEKDVELLTLSFTPVGEGELTIRFDTANTLVPDHKNSQNILTTLPTGAYKVIAVSDEKVAEAQALQDKMAKAPEKNTLLFYALGGGVMILILLVMGVGFVVTKRRRANQLSSEMSQVGMTMNTDIRQNNADISQPPMPPVA